jgi:hypothetical protein
MASEANIYEKIFLELYIISIGIYSYNSTLQGLPCKFDMCSGDHETVPYFIEPGNFST